MSITELFLIYIVGAFLWAVIGAGVCWVFMSISRPDAHTKEDDDEQADYLQAVRREAERRRVKAYPITEIKS